MKNVSLEPVGLVAVIASMESRVLQDLSLRSMIGVGARASKEEQAAQRESENTDGLVQQAGCEVGS